MQSRGTSVKLVKGFIYKGYHIEENDAQKALKKIQKIRSKSAKHILASRLVDQDKVDLSKVVVTVQDSLNSGNCETGTKSFKERYKLENYITAKALLELSNDYYTQRAVRTACLRHAQESL